jgi:hypothetical protein
VNIQDENFYSTTEAQSAIENLSGEDIIKIKKFINARTLLFNTNYTDDDLIGESVMRTLAGDRSWNRKLNIVQHLIGVVRSVADGEHQKFQKNVVRNTDLLEKDKQIIEIDVTHNGPVAQYENENNYKAIIEILKCDKLAYKIINLLDEGKKRRDIIKELNISNKEYDTKKKYISRKVTKLINERNPNG